MHKLKEKLMEELYMFEEKAEKSGSARISEAELNKIHKLTDTVKNICKIDMLEEGGDYSEDADWMGEGRMYGTSYARGGRGRGRGARRDSMGRYSREGGYSEEGSSYAGGRGGQGGGGGRGGQGGGRGGSSYGGYSRDDGKEEMIERLEEMMGEVGGTREREAIKRCIRELEE